MMSLCFLALVKRELLPVGAAYLSHVRRAINNHTFEQHDEINEETRRKALNGNDDNIEDDLGVGDEEETEDLLQLDPKEWKVRCYTKFEAVVNSLVYIYFFVSYRNKTITLYSVYHTSAIARLKIRLRSHVGGLFVRNIYRLF
jgi:hypothetical protein